MATMTNVSEDMNAATHGRVLTNLKKCITFFDMLYYGESHLQHIKQDGQGHAGVRASITVRGIEEASRKSEKARLKMKMFRAVLISFFQTTADITIKLPTTAID